MNTLRAVAAIILWAVGVLTAAWCVVSALQHPGWVIGGVAVILIGAEVSLHARK